MSDMVAWLRTVIQEEKTYAECGYESYAYDPQEQLARCEAELAILAEHELEPIPMTICSACRRVHEAKYGALTHCRTCGSHGEDPPCQTVRLLGYGRRHRDGWREDWAPHLTQ